MSSLAMLALASTATLAPVLRAPRGVDTPFVVEADRLSSEGGIFVAEGHATLRRRGAVVHADAIRFDEARGVAVAEGNVTAVDGNAVLTCRRVEMRVPELTGGLEAGELRIKSSLPEELLDRLEPGALRTHGTNEMILSSGSLERTGPRTFELEDGSFTVCDCGEGSTPSWRIEAQGADVDLDSGAWMYWPVFYVSDVPVFALPAFYFPLGDRRSGLLTPRPSFSPATGFTVRQPLYLVLGDPADLTFEAAYLSSRGPGGLLELRWAPHESSRGQLRTSVIADFGERDADGDVHKDRRSPLVRYAVAVDHATRLEGGTTIAADIDLIGDPQHQGDFADDFLARQIESSRSRITVAHASESLRVAGGLQLLEDLRPHVYAGAADDLREVQLLSGALPGAGAIRHRFAELRLDAPAHALFEGWPLAGEARVSVQAFAAPRPEVPRFVRADVRPSLFAPIDVFGAFVVEPSITGRATVWAGRADQVNADRSRFALLGRAALYTTLWRDFGHVVHRIRPEVAYLIVPEVWTGGDDVFGTGDEIDQLGPVSQVRGRIGSDFVSPAGARIGGFELSYGYDLPLADRSGIGSSEIVVRGDAPILPVDWPVRALAQALVGIDPRRPSVTEIFGALAVTFPYGSVSLAYLQHGGRPPQYDFVGPEELVYAGTIDASAYVPAVALDDPFAEKPWSRFRGLIGSIRVRPYEPLTIAFDIGLTIDDPDALLAAYGSRSVVRDTRTSIRWDSPCDCWSAELAVTTARDRPDLPGVQFSLDLARLGGL